MECSRCNSKAIYSARYSGMNYCRKHFEENFEKRVKHEIREQVRFKQSRNRIAVALSGGKDSSVLLFMLQKILGERRNLELFAVTVDEGIAGYRDKEMISATKLCALLGIEHVTLSYREKYSITMDEIVSRDADAIPCSHCGPMRRQVMNQLALSVDADYIALGINLDDYSQSVMMNVIKGDTDRMARMAPHDQSGSGLVPRILPLRKIPEKEVMLFAMLNGIKEDRISCPYYARAERNEVREILSDLEERHPGTMYAVSKFGDSTKAALKLGISGQLTNCRICGNPTEYEICSVCKNLEQSNLI